MTPLGKVIIFLVAALAFGFGIVPFIDRSYDEAMAKCNADPACRARMAAQPKDECRRTSLFDMVVGL